MKRKPQGELYHFHVPLRNTEHQKLSSDCVNTLYLWMPYDKISQFLQHFGRSWLSHKRHCNKKSPTSFKSHGNRNWGKQTGSNLNNEAFYLHFPSQNFISYSYIKRYPARFFSPKFLNHNFFKRLILSTYNLHSPYSALSVTFTNLIFYCHFPFLQLWQ